jgi:allophanate hydrolase subunit 2
MCRLCSAVGQRTYELDLAALAVDRCGTAKNFQSTKIHSAQKFWSISCAEKKSRAGNRRTIGRIQRAANRFYVLFVASPDSDRMGIRLDGPRLERNEDVDLLSEAVAPGTVQVPPSGKPILLLNDCQTIGGYPKIGHVIRVDFPIAAQLSPGDRIRFSEVSIADAHALLLERERNLEQFRRGLESHFK